MQGYEDVKMLQDAEDVADNVWQQAARWDKFARDTVAGQFVRAVDSIGANIAESYGRFHYGEKLQFLYYARGSVFETKYWLNRALKRGLISEESHQSYAARLAAIARQINGFAKHLKGRRATKMSSHVLKESAPIYHVLQHESLDEAIVFSSFQLRWLQTGLDADHKTLNTIRNNPRHGVDD